MTETNMKKIIEINGVKLEVDLSQAKVISNYKVGDTVKVLIKEYSNYDSHVGVIIGFDNFEKLPTIIIAYLKIGYQDAQVKMVYFNAESENIEITMASDKELNFDYTSSKDLLQRDIDNKQEEFEKARKTLAYFERHFERRFESFKLEETKS